MWLAVHPFTESYWVPTLFPRCTACHWRTTGPPTVVFTLPLLLLYGMTAQMLVLLFLSCSSCSELCQRCCNYSVTVAWQKSLIGCIFLGCLGLPANRLNFMFGRYMAVIFFNPSQHIFVHQGHWNHNFNGHFYYSLHVLACAPNSLVIDH